MENKTTPKNRRDAAHLTARQLGIDMFTSNAFATKPENSHKWVFGPDPDKDSVWQSLPQVTLHGFDEGLPETEFCNARNGGHRGSFKAKHGSYRGILIGNIAIVIHPLVVITVQLRTSSLKVINYALFTTLFCRA